MKLSPPLDRRFRVIAFDWDGTAVENRRENAELVCGSIERLLRAGVLVVVITGTNMRNLIAQIGPWIHGPCRRNLFLAANRGSEVFGFDGGGEHPVLLWKRTASEDEERLLSRAAEGVRDELMARTGLAVEIVYDRLNRRKVDLIPTPEWRDPPKSEMARLVEEVELRLRKGGLDGGIAEALELAERIVAVHGLQGARITSDVKHLEIGLTDKADSIAWMMRELVRPRGIAAEEILIGGDEFGPVGGSPGSDSKMIVPEARRAVFVSVGPEPAGVPPPVLHLGGGPERFRMLLARQAALHPVLPLGLPEPDPEWICVEETFIPAREHEIESLFAIGNGYAGVRASLPEGAGMSRPATFLAGVFETPAETDLPTLAVMPDWSQVVVRIEGRPVRMGTVESIEHRRTLDMRQGALWRRWRCRDPEGRVTSLNGLRVASQGDRQLLLQSLSITPENWSGRLEIELGLGRAAAVDTSTGTRATLVAATEIETPGRVLHTDGQDEGATVRRTLDVSMGESYRIDRVLSVATSRDSDDPAASAARRLQRAVRARGIDGVFDAHRDAWDTLWRQCDIRIEGDPDAERALRFAVYHLLSSANPDDERVSIGARGLTGLAYKGHVFWDTEIFMLPFFIYTMPSAARSLLMYRYHTLPGARAKAARLGYRGAMYAWESAETGDEVAPEFVLSPEGEVIQIYVATQEQHISADVAYAVWNYCSATGDDAFLAGPGAEILLDTARFWSSRAALLSDDRYHIECVIGPDEYHEAVDDNAFTNGMAKWNIERALEVAAWLQETRPDRWRALHRTLALEPAELERWRDVAERMTIGFDETTGLIEQFRGYFDLEQIDFAPFRRRTAPLDVLLGRERVQRSQVIKQADVLMLILLLWDRFSPQVREANFHFYEPRTDHASSLSPGMHALYAARLGEAAVAERYFRQTMAIDLANNMGNAAGGVHAAALGGLWQAAVFGFAGLQIGAEVPTVDPRLPAAWSSMRFSVMVRGTRTEFSLAREHAEARTLTAELS